MTGPTSPKVTLLPVDRWLRRVPADRYTSREFFETEKERIFSRAWLAAGPAWSLERPGDYFTLNELEQSVLVLRDEDGRIRAFHNVCRHRGSRLLTGCGRVDGIRCPYHGWSYRLDGSLASITKGDGFETLLEHRRFGLHEIQSEIWMGYVWIHLEGNAPPLRETLGGIAEQLDPYLLHEMRPVQTFETVYPFNWKAMLENAMDFYHVPFVHNGTINPGVVEPPDLTSYGDHTRQRLDIARDNSWRVRLDRRCTRAGPYTPRQIGALHKYLLFPNFLINVLPYHLTVMQVFPVTPRSCRLKYSFCRRRGARGIELARAVATWAASRYILWEDIKVLHAFQAGVNTGRTPIQYLHSEEAAASHFHGVISRWVSD
jgi:phenylpropionate dioxygenase-like ring-hydroxylating dioxygenase large terminal subunit